MHGALGVLLLFLALPPLSVPWAVLVVFVPWFLAARHGVGAASWNGLIFGAGSAYCTYLGVAAESAPLLVAIVAALGLGFALAGALLATAWPRAPWIAALIAASLVVGMELALTSAGVPWVHAVLIAEGSPLLGWLPLAGSHFVTFLLVGAQWLAACALVRGANALRNRQVAGYVAIRPAARASLGAAMLYLIAVGGGYAWLEHQPSRDIGELDLAMVQTRIDTAGRQYLLREGALRSRQKQQTALMEQLSAGDVGADTLVIWPETAFPGFAPTIRSWFWRHATERPWHSLVQAYEWDAEGPASKAYMVGNGGKVLAQSAKHRPVPIVEDLLRGPAEQPAPLTINGRKIGALICFDIAFARHALDQVAQGADLLVNLSNDAFLGPSFMPWLMADLARLRALETGRPVIRSANGGESQVIDHQGNTLMRLPLFLRDVRHERLHLSAGLSPYARASGGVEWVLSALALAALAVSVPALTRSERERNGRSAPAERVSMVATTLMMAAIIAFVLTNLQRELPLEMLHAGTRDADMEWVTRPLAPVEANQADQAALAILLRSFGEPVTSSDVPGTRGAQAAWLAAHGLRLSSMAMPEGPGPHFAVLDYPGPDTRILRLVPDREAVIFMPGTGRFQDVSGALEHWLERSDALWLAPVTAATRTLR